MCNLYSITTNQAAIAALYELTASGSLFARSLSGPCLEVLVRRFLAGFSFAGAGGGTVGAGSGSFRTSTVLNDAKTICDFEGSTSGGGGGCSGMAGGPCISACSGTAEGASISSTG